MKVILYQPQIPQNTGNIVRTCAAAEAGLILVRPLGFSTSNRHLKRAGLDYWEGVEVEEIDDLLSCIEDKPVFFFSSKAEKSYTKATYPPDALLVFGSETEGLPLAFRERWPDRFFRIPMSVKARCLNLACSVSIVLFEALRQQNHFLKSENTSERTMLSNAEVASGR